MFGLEKGKKLFPSNINLLLLALGGIIYGGVGIASIFLGEEFLSYNPLGSTPQSGQHIGIPNIVTSVLASYRGYDTFGETIVVFTAGIAVLVLLQNNKKSSKDTKPKIKKKVGRNA